MTSRDLVIRTLEFQYPERIPLGRGESADIGYVTYVSPGDFLPAGEGRNEWGLVRRSLHRDQGDQGQALEHPLADWSNAAHFRFPDPRAPGRLDRLAGELEQLRRKSQFVVADIGKGPIHLLTDLRGFEASLVDMLEHSVRTEFLLNGIFDFLGGMVDRFSGSDIDAVWITDDQAIQTGPLISMELWRHFFEWRYAALFRLAHDRGFKVFLHTCGNLSQHLVPLMNAGVDVIDNKQPSLWQDCPALDHVRGKMSFSTCVDVQTTIHAANEKEIESIAHRLIGKLSVPAGGFIGTYYPNSDLQIPTSKMFRMLEAFRTFRWKSQGRAAD